MNYFPFSINFIQVLLGTYEKELKKKFVKHEH